MSDLWLFLSDPDNQKTLAWLGGGVAAVVGALWTAFTFLAQREPPPAPPSREASPSPRAATAGAGIAAAGNVHVGGDMRIEHGKLPRGALLLLAIGLVVLLYAVLTSRGDVSVTGGSYVGGDVRNGDINVQLTPAPKQP
jgi:hypothetical protein